MVKKPTTPSQPIEQPDPLRRVLDQAFTRLRPDLTRIKIVAEQVFHKVGDRVRGGDRATSSNPDGSPETAERRGLGSNPDVLFPHPLRRATDQPPVPVPD